MRNYPLSYYVNKAQSLNPCNKNNIKKVAILGNFNIKGISEILKVTSNENGSYLFYEIS